jgi:hypothetical protein
MSKSKHVILNNSRSSKTSTHSEIDKHLLYNDLKEQVQKIHMEADEINNALSKITEIRDKWHIELLLDLIIHCEKTFNRQSGFRECPYKGKICKGNRGITFRVSNLPISVQEILAMYVYLIF